MWLNSYYCFDNVAWYLYIDFGINCMWYFLWFEIDDILLKDMPPSSITISQINDASLSDVV